MSALTWTPASGPVVSYTLQIWLQGEQTPRTMRIKNNEAELPFCVTGMVARVRAVGEGQVGPWSDGNLITCLREVAPPIDGVAALPLWGVLALAGLLLGIRRWVK